LLFPSVVQISNRATGDFLFIMMTCMGEFEYINWIRQKTSADPRVLVGPGDDAAVLAAPSGSHWLVTTDMLLEGSHFCLGEASARRVGRKAMAVNLSDIAAMAGRPVAAVASLGLPRGSGQEMAEQLYLGLRDMADAFATVLVGGDTNSWDGPLVLSVTLMGETTGRGPVTRAGARPGDWLMVTGPLGGSIRGKHLDFVPRVKEAQLLHEKVDLHAMIDISDGLAADANHLGEESGCGIVLRAEAIPVSEAAPNAADKRSPLDQALGDGEDFELLFALSPADGALLLRTQPIAGLTLFHIGECIDARGLYLEDSGQQRILPPMGYVHNF
jgi:thiamine-monophosphate kinase